MNRRSAIAAALLARVCVAPCIAANRARGQKPSEALLHAQYFSVWGVGYAGVPTENEKALCAFMKDGASVADALRLIHEGTPAGKIYGLLALKSLSPKLFPEAAAGVVKQHAGVKILHGCDPNPATESTRKLAKEIADGTICIRTKRE